MLVKDRRGAATKYDFTDMKVGEDKSYPGATTGSLLNCAKRFCAIRGLDWKFRCYTTDDLIAHIVRIK